MAAAVSVSPANVAEPLVPMTVSGSGFAATTDYVVKVTTPQGHVRTVNVKSDGSGAFSFIHVPTEVGTSTFDARPLAETNGTTTAAATVQAKVRK